MLPQRLAETVLVKPGADEAGRLYRIVGGSASRARRRAARRLALRSLTRLAGSSPAAAAPTLAKIGWADLAERAPGRSAPARPGCSLERLRTPRRPRREGAGLHRVPADAGRAGAGLAAAGSRRRSTTAA